MEGYAPNGRTGAPAPGGKGARQLAAAALALSLLAVGLAAAALYFVLREPPVPPTFQYGDRTMQVVEGIEKSPYDPDGFGVDEQGRICYEKDGKQARTGIDVSVYQGEIDWQAVARDGIEFAILRLGYRGYGASGLLVMDEQFQRNLEGARAAGLDVGVYFFSQAISPAEAREEAAFVLEAVGEHELAYPIAFDWEPIAAGQGARTEGLDGAVLTACAAAFCQEVAAAGYEPAVYFNQDLGYLRYDLEKLQDQVLWLAEYDGTPDFYYRFDLWQYSHNGRVEGIQGSVDMDLDMRTVL